MRVSPHPHPPLSESATVHSKALCSRSYLHTKMDPNLDCGQVCGIIPGTDHRATSKQSINQSINKNKTPLIEKNSFGEIKFPLAFFDASRHSTQPLTVASKIARAWPMNIPCEDLHSRCSSDPQCTHSKSSHLTNSVQEFEAARW